MPLLAYRAASFAGAWFRLVLTPCGCRDRHRTCTDAPTPGDFPVDSVHLRYQLLIGLFATQPGLHLPGPGCTGLKLWHFG